MRQLSCVVRDELWQRLQRQSKETDEPVSHIINRALANYLGFEAHTIYQVSTSTAIVEGIYQGVVRAGTLREHGDLGLGTFEKLDGEMVVVDGHVYQARCDGSVHEVGDDVLSPFAAVRHFSPDTLVALQPCSNFENLIAQVDRLRDSENMFYSIRVDGHFETMQYEFGAPRVYRHRCAVRELDAALFHSPGCDRAVHCRHGRLDCKFEPLPSRGLLRK